MPGRHKETPESGATTFVVFEKDFWGMVSGWAMAFVVEMILMAVMGMLQRRRELRPAAAAH